MNKLALLLLLTPVFVGCDHPEPGPLPIPTVTGEPQPLPVPTPSGTPSARPSVSPRPSPSASPSPSPTPTLPVYNGPKELGPYLADFLADGARLGKQFDTAKLTLQWGELTDWGSSVIGLCDTNSSPVLTIKKSWWTKQNDLQRKQLMHHELGHCLLWRGHRSGNGKDGLPLSMMNPVVLTGAQFTRKPAYYLDELFNYEEARTKLPLVHVCYPENL